MNAGWRVHQRTFCGIARPWLAEYSVCIDKIRTTWDTASRA